MNKLNIDELNVLSSEENIEIDKNENTRSLPYEKYFGDMDLTKDQEEERIEFSKLMEDKLLFLFSLIATMHKFNAIDQNYLRSVMVENYKQVISSFMDLDDYMLMYIDNFSIETIETSIKNLEKVYTLSQDRARFVSENEANTSLNYKDYIWAIASGKTKKTWYTMEDNKVRKSHKKVSRKTLPIADPFLVGKSLMQFPKDYSLGGKPEEIVNCRCWIKYH